MSIAIERASSAMETNGVVSYITKFYAEIMNYKR